MYVCVGRGGGRKAMSGEIIRERKYVSLMEVQDHQVQCPSSCTLQPYRSTTHIFFTQDPYLYLEFAKSRGGGEGPEFPPRAFLPVSWFSSVSQGPPVPCPL